MSSLQSLAAAVLYILPAYVANGSPVVGVKLIGRKTPIDRGARAWDGRRVLGDGKTFEGLIIGLTMGTLTGIVISLIISPSLYRSFIEPFLLSLGAMLGDILGSFIKRRLGLQRGQPAPPMDQLGFAVFALLLAFSLYGVPAWADLLTIIALLTVTAFLHVGTNFLAYLVGLKPEPY